MAVEVVVLAVAVAGGRSFACLRLRSPDQSRGGAFFSGVAGAGVAGREEELSDEGESTGCGCRFAVDNPCEW